MPDPSMPPDFPPEALPVFEHLLARDLHPVEHLRTQVDRHLRDLEKAQATHEYLDLSTAEDLARSAHRLLDLYEDGAGDPDRRLIQAAVLYFILDHDAAPDSRAILGLEDDALVMLSVLHHFRMEDDSL